MHQRTKLFSDEDRFSLQRASDVVKEAIRVLQSCSKPDTFLGRKTQEPFPVEKEE